MAKKKSSKKKNVKLYFCKITPNFLGTGEPSANAITPTTVKGIPKQILIMANSRKIANAIAESEFPNGLKPEVEMKRVPIKNKTAMRFWEISEETK